MRYLVIVGAFGLVACGNTYHPEYHPVTVTQYSQDLSYPVSVHNAGPAAERSPVVIAQPVMPAMPPPPRPPTPPANWPSE